MSTNPESLPLRSSILDGNCLILDWLSPAGSPRRFSEPRQYREVNLLFSGAVDSHEPARQTAAHAEQCSNRASC